MRKLRIGLAAVLLLLSLLLLLLANYPFARRQQTIPFPTIEAPLRTPMSALGQTAGLI